MKLSSFIWLNPFHGSSDPEPVLRDVFDWYEHGIFSGIADYADQSSLELPWDDISAQILDLIYFGNHSGSKFCSPIVKLMLENDDYVTESGKLTNTAVSLLGNIILTKYLTKWAALWGTTVAEYNPIHNYDMYEERDLATTADNVETTDNTLSRTGTDTLTHGLTETTDYGRTNESMMYKYGINTVTNDPKPSDKETSEEGGDTTVTNTGDDVRTLDLSDETDATVTEDNEGTEHEEIHRSGNIGVTTTQQMLQQERELWKWNFFEQVFSDVDEQLALMVHDPCRV